MQKLLGRCMAVEPDREGKPVHQERPSAVPSRSSPPDFTTRDGKADGARTAPPNPTRAAQVRDKLNGSSVLPLMGFSSEDPIIQSALSGDESAFEWLFHRYRRQVLHLCLQYSGGDHDQAHDLCQEAFISAFLQLGRLRDRSRFFYWIAEIARNKCVSFARKQRVIVKTLREYEVIKPAMADTAPRWSETELQLIEELISDLDNPALRETVRLFYVEGKRTGEIAQLQQISQTAVTTRLNRFRVRFRKRLTQEILKRRISH